ncbi:tetratricopeptide repeat protein [bacterium]|nr:tetratricopeptide repeat protein [bacterium]
MKKYLLLLLLTLVFVGVPSYAAQNTSSALNDAVKKYKAKNYVGCIQDTLDITKKDPSNAVAYYYLAISYANIGKKDEAISAYEKVVSLSTNNTLSDYAERGQLCLENTEACKKKLPENFDKELDNFIKGTQGISNEVKQHLKDVMIEQRKYEINKEVDELSSAMPSNDEIAEAVKTLAKVGVNPVQFQNNPYFQAQQALTQNPEYMQLQMMLGNNNQNNGGMDIMGMLPYLVGQGKNGASNMSADMIKNMMMSSMMGNISTTFDVDTKN